jgi:putative addiction module component (TIGR02574 family)
LSPLIHELLKIKKRMTKILEQITHLSIEEQIVLVERVWDNIAEDKRAQNLEISPELEAELARRLLLIQTGQTQFFTWEQVEKNILAHA